MGEGILFIVCGPSGVGKTSLCERLLRSRDRLTLSISYTTRAPRDGERDGVDYHFVDVETFRKMRLDNQFAEWAEVHGNFYGTAIQVIKDNWSRGRDILFDIDYQGARQLKECFVHACTTLVIPPDMQALESRLRGRATDSEAVIQRRLAAARHELSQYELFDFIVENRELETASHALHQIYDSQHYARHLHVGQVRRMLDQQ